MFFCFFMDKNSACAFIYYSFYRQLKGGLLGAVLKRKDTAIHLGCSVLLLFA